jgi:hypothetical protein
MKEVTLKIPDQKFDFFMNLVKELGFEVSEKVEIPEEHKKVVRERVKKSEDKPQRLVEWDKVKDNFKFD